MQKPWGSFERYTHNLASTVKVITVALVQNDTAARIPGGAVRLIEGVGHGAFDERKRDFDAAVEGFTRR